MKKLLVILILSLLLVYFIPTKPKGYVTMLMEYHKWVVETMKRMAEDDWWKCDDINQEPAENKDFEFIYYSMCFRNY